MKDDLRLPKTLSQLRPMFDLIPLSPCIHESQPSKCQTLGSLECFAKANLVGVVLDIQHTQFLRKLWLY